MDRGELDQILVNLAANARDAMPHGGRVTVETSCCEPASGNGRPELVLLSMSDTGDGIAAETVSHIFEPFYTTKGVARTGLGLSAVYGIVEQAGGRIEVDTEVGTGTRFRIYLPAVTPDADRPSPRALPDQGPPRPSCCRARRPTKRFVGRLVPT